MASESDADYASDEVLQVRSFPQLRGGFREASLKVLKEVLAGIPCPVHDRRPRVHLLGHERVRVEACCSALVDRIVDEIEGVARE